ncbi:hypothetical protein D1BOALGB6SA_9299 [Olavius sp. associated proteobacterium Delta 1]|nr:hypothetical protein D1BOALGB6SA_9299 [Olavius sp. associated proteobacterium Delta 1]
MEYYIIPDKEALSQCAACQGNINEMTEVFGLGAKLKPGVDLSEFESHCIQIDLVSDESPVYMMITAQGSEAKNDGNDCMFLVCSESCSQKLTKVLEKEISLGKMFETVLRPE